MRRRIRQNSECDPRARYPGPSLPEIRCDLCAQRPLVNKSRIKLMVSAMRNSTRHRASKANTKSSKPENAAFAIGGNPKWLSSQIIEKCMARVARATNWAASSPPVTWRTNLHSAATECPHIPRRPVSTQARDSTPTARNQHMGSWYVNGIIAIIHNRPRVASLQPQGENNAKNSPPCLVAHEEKR